MEKKLNASKKKKQKLKKKCFKFVFFHWQLDIKKNII